LLWRRSVGFRCRIVTLKAFVSRGSAVQYAPQKTRCEEQLAQIGSPLPSIRDTTTIPSPMLWASKVPDHARAMVCPGVRGPRSSDRLISIGSRGGQYEPVVARNYSAVSLMLAQDVLKLSLILHFRDHRDSERKPPPTISPPPRNIGMTALLEWIRIQRDTRVMAKAPAKFQTNWF